MVETAAGYSCSLARMFALKRSVVAFAVMLSVVLSEPLAAQAEELPAPAVTTLAATDATGTTAKFHAKITTNNTPTIGYFAYGTEPDQLRGRTPEVSFVPGAGEVPLDAEVLGLQTNTKYYVIAVVENDDWIVTCDLESFSTLARPQIVGGTVSDITFKSATLHLNLVTHGQSVTVVGGAWTSPVLGGSTIRFGPYSVAADGDVAIPLTGLDAGMGYVWFARATSVGGEDTVDGGLRTESLIKMPKPTVVPAVATYGARVTISGTIPNKPGLAVTLAEQAYPFSGPIRPLARMAAATDTAGAYTFDLFAEHPVAYGVTAEGAITLAARNLTRLKVAPAVTVKAKRARRHRYVVAGRHQPAVRSVVSLYRRGAGRVGDERVSYGTFRFPARVLKPGKYEVRVIPDVDTGFVRGKSAVFTIPRR
ncbi:MAG: hypothetical protein ABW167_16980 [Baekduia sp.]